MKLRIDSIKIGDRRREEMGDIQGLADSISKYGLLHPIVVEGDLNLVAGRRRLAACQALEYEYIEATQLGKLTVQQLRTLELEGLPPVLLGPVQRNPPFCCNRIGNDSGIS